MAKGVYDEGGKDTLNAQSAQEESCAREQAKRSTREKVERSTREKTDQALTSDVQLNVSKEDLTTLELIKCTSELDLQQEIVARKRQKLVQENI